MGLKVGDIVLCKKVRAKVLEKEMFENKLDYLLKPLAPSESCFGADCKGACECSGWFRRENFEVLK